MAYSEYETLMMQVLVNLENRIVPLNKPPSCDFLTPEILSDLFEASSYNENVKCYYFVNYVCSNPVLTSGAVDVYYYPFDFPTYFIKYTLDMKIELDEIFVWGGSINEKRLFLEELKRATLFGLEPYIVKQEDGLYSTVIATRKDNPFEPLNIKSFVMEDYPTSTTLHKAFGYEMPPPDTVFYNWKFSTGSSINYDNVARAPIEIMNFRAQQPMGLILKPSLGQEPLPYHYVPIYYANPLYGYYSDYYNIYPFEGGGFDDKGNRLIKGHCLAVGFRVVWIDGGDLWITPKYKIIYSDKRPEQLNKKCCLAECFGIKE